METKGSISPALVPRTQNSLFSLMKPLLRYSWVIRWRSVYNYRLDTEMLTLILLTRVALAKKILSGTRVRSNVSFSGSPSNSY